ncbi:hypothetical protein PVAND_015378 [Polypedilum vanderplanki]|uniref:Gustatory receptor n=1 Tax=Polypedilum vanderplanki TaxID=319348 RepID=A0A9J6BCF6_POLVA|nr:hypothetical protein PVAND_015378 [Polypedilum vanderplanki]
MILEICIYMKCRLQLMQSIFGVCAAFKYRENFFEIIKKFELIDLKLKFFKISRNYSSDLKFSIILLVVFNIIFYTVTSLTSFQLFVYDVYHHSIPLENLFFLVGVLCSAIFEYTYAVLLIAIYVRLKSLIKFVKKSNNLCTRDFKLLNFIYSNLIDVMKLANQIFSLNAFFGLTELSIHLVFICFSAYQVVLSEYKFDLFLYTLSGFGYFISKLPYYFLIIFYSTLVRTFGNDLWIEINKKQNFDQKEKKFREIVIRQMRCNELIASCGVYEFDWIVFFAIMTGAFSYLVVMIQFDLGIDKK